MNLSIQGDFDPARLPRTAAALAAQLDVGQAMGGQLWVGLGAETVVDAAFGAARPGEPMTRDHLMLWMSASKPVAAVAIVMLWEQGRLNLDDPVARYLPEFASGGKTAVTIRHLLTHTSGIRMIDTGWPAAEWPEILAKICARPLEPRWVPGRKAGYHLTSSWFVLAELIRRLDGRPFERWVREELFEPLGCSDCWIGMPVERWREYGGRLAPMYAAEEEGLRDLAAGSELLVTRCSPGGNGWGPIRELARFYRMLASGGELDGRRYLRPQTVEALAARHRVGLLDHTFKARLDWGLGVIVNSAHYGDPNPPYGYGPHAGPRTWGHSGARSSVAFVDPDAGLVAALAVDGLPDEESHRQRFERWTAALYEDLGLVPV